MGQHLEERIATLEKSVEDAVETRLQRLEDILNDKIGESVDQMVEEGRGWMIPFVVLSCGLVAGVAVVYRKYYVIQKLHQA